MTALDTWRTRLKTHLTDFAPLVKDRPHIDKIYGLIGAAVLWEIRDCQPEQVAALNTACASEPHTSRLVAAMEGWIEYTRLEALEDLNRKQRDDESLRDAITALLGHFARDLLAEKALTQIHIEGSVRGGNIVIGGAQFIEGDLIIRQENVLTCPPLPDDPAHFGGRDAALNTLMDDLRAGTTTAITAVQGMGGIGKTTLAKRLTHRLHGTIFRAVLWTPITDQPDARAHLTAWARYGDSSFMPPPDMKDSDLAAKAKASVTAAIAQACDDCEGQRVLVVLDDVWPSGIAAARLLQQAAPDQATILMTTRYESVAIDLHATRHTLRYLTPDEAEAMLATYLPEANLTGLRALGEALDGHPLALALAARRLEKEMGDPGATLNGTMQKHTHQYKEGLTANSTFAQLKLEQGEQREDNLSVALAYSYQALTAEAKSHFRALGVLVADGTFELPLLAALWDMPAESETLADAARELRLAGLIEVEGTAYRQHRLLRAYARALLNEAGEMEGIFGRYADFMIQVARQFITLPPEDWDSTLTPQYPHILHVGDELVRQTEKGTKGDIQRALNFANNITRYLANRREIQRMDWLDMGLEAARTLQIDADPERAKAYQKFEKLFLNEIGVAWDTLGEKHKALSYYEQKLLIDHMLGNQGGEATLNNIGNAWNALGEKRKALHYYAQALPLLQAVGNRGGEATTLNNIGLAWNDLGETRKALDYYAQALLIHGEIGNRTGEATTLTNIGLAWDDLGETRKALEYYAQALPLRRAVGDRGGEAATLTNIGSAWSALGETRKALDYYAQALPVFHAVGDRGGEATTLNNIGQVWHVLGETRKALDYYAQALALHQAVEDRSGEATTLNNMGFTYFQAGDLDKTVEIQQQIITVFQSIGAVSEQASCLYNIAIVYRHMGRIEDAIQSAQAGKEILLRYNLPQSASGTTIAEYDTLLAQLQQPTQNMLPDNTVQTLAQNTYVVKTVASDQLSQWREDLLTNKAGWSQRGDDYAIEVLFLDALLAILDDQTPTLPPDNPYADTVQEIMAAIEKYREEGKP